MSKPKVLIVEDDLGMREIIRHVYHENGWETFPVAYASLAVEVFRGVHFDIVHTDGDLPDMTGIELTKKIREINPDAIVYMLSGEAAYRRPFLDAGGWDFYHKSEIARWRSDISKLETL